MIVAHSYLKSLCQVVLGICDLPSPHVYYLYNGKVELLEGLDTSFLSEKFLEFLLKEENEDVKKIDKNLIAAYPYEFLLSIKLEDMYNSPTYLLVIDTVTKPFNDRQIDGLKEARKSYLTSLARELHIKELQKQSKGLSLLNTINEGDLKSQLEQGLKLTSEYFGLNGGIISRIKENSYEVKYIYPENLGFEIGQKMPFEDTYCDIAMMSEGPVAIDCMKESPYAAHQCYTNFAQESYIGAIYETENYRGSVSFSSKEVRQKLFSKYELEYIEVFARWVGNTKEADLKRRKALAKNEILYAFVQSSPVAIAMFDRNIKYLAASKKWLQDYGIKRDVIGISHYEIFPEIGDDWKQIHKKAMAGESFEQAEEKFTRADGSIQWIQWDVRPWYNLSNEIGGIVMYTGDVSHYVLQRQKLTIAKLAAEKAAAVKEQFTYIASHDLKEPVRTITSLSELLHKNYSAKLDKRGQKMLDYIAGSANRMNLLINGLLDFSRLGKNKSLQTINLSAIVDEVISTLETEINLKGAQFEIKELPTFIGYAVEIRLLMQNLISNAIKYSKPDVPPKIKISAKKESLYHQIKVSDNGIGIPSKNHKKIFQIFQQLADREDQEGLGIGLANCYRIVEIHHGNIWVEANDTGGSDFYFTIFHRLDQLALKAL